MEKAKELCQGFGSRRQNSNRDTMAQSPVVTFPRFLEVFQTQFTRPTFRNMVILAAGWVLAPQGHAVTDVLVATGASGIWHHAAFHRFFSDAIWEPDWWGLDLLWRLRHVLAPGGVLRGAIDDTLAEKRGSHIHGIGTHLDAVRSTRSFKVFCFGHVWVTFCVLVDLPFSRRPWALPVLFRLYRSKKAAVAARLAYRTKTELAREMLHVVAVCFPDWRLHVSADNAYANNTVLDRLPANVTFVGAMRPDAVLTAVPITPKKTRGRRRLRGTLLPKPSALADDGTRFQSAKVRIYGEDQVVFFKTCLAQWYRACGATLLRIVVVRCERGTIPFRVYFCTDASLTVVQIIELYSGRWAIETCFRNLKQFFGFADSSARTKSAVCRTAPFVGLLYSSLVLWFTLHHFRTDRPTAGLPCRPWYRSKTDLSFEDVLRAARGQLVSGGILDPARMLADFTKTPTWSAPPTPRPRENSP